MIATRAMLEFSAETRGLLAAVLDRLLPGDRPWPSAAKLELAARVDAQTADWPELREGISAALAALPAGFVGRDGKAQDDALRALETAEPAVFGRLVTAAYNAYYTHPKVRRVIERRTGYPARPPQPKGYEMPEFDETLLEPVKQRAPFWRKP